MLSEVWNNDRAIAVNIKWLFTKMRDLLSGNLSLEIEEIKKKLTNYDKNTELVFTY